MISNTYHVAFAAGIVFWKKSHNMKNARFTKSIPTAFGFKIYMQKRSCREEWQKLLAIVQHIDVSKYNMCIIHVCLQFCAFGNSIKLYNLLVLVILCYSRLCCPCQTYGPFTHGDRVEVKTKNNNPYSNLSQVVCKQMTWQCFFCPNFLCQQRCQFIDIMVEMFEKIKCAALNIVDSLMHKNSNY